MWHPCPSHESWNGEKEKGRWHSMWHPCPSHESWNGGQEKAWKCGSVTNRSPVFTAVEGVQSHLQEVQVLHAHSQSCGRDRKEIVVHVVASPENGCRAGRAPARKTCRRLQSKKLQERGTVSHPVAIMCGTRDCVGLDSIYGLPLRVRAGRRGGA